MVNDVVEFIGVPTEEELLSIVVKHSRRSYAKRLFNEAMKELRKSLEEKKEQIGQLKGKWFKGDINSAKKGLRVLANTRTACL